MTTLIKIKLQNDERSCWRNTAERTTTKKKKKKKRDKRQRKDTDKLTKRGQENWRLHRVKILDLSARKALKIRKCHRLNTAKCYENTNSEYIIEYT